MKILSYNINRSTQEKIDKIMQFNADVFILPEVITTGLMRIRLSSLTIPFLI